jgi:hypothetical protein
MRSLRHVTGAILLMLSTPALSRGQQTFVFNTDPFAGSTALTMPGRQIVGGEDFITFNIATDVLAFEGSVFGMGGSISFANGLVGALPSGGLNAVVLQTFDSDAATAGNQLAAGSAASLLAAQFTTPGAGVFVYFNSGLDLPRLVYSPNLSDETADLRVLARFTNLSGQAGRDLMPTFTAANFAIVTTVPEPSSLLLFAGGAALLVGVKASRRERP